jgi:hypothetical protein
MPLAPSDVGDATVFFAQTPDYRLISQAAAAAFAAARLLHFGLRRRYPILFSYLIVSTILSTIFSILSIKSRAYYWAYILAQPVSWCVAALAVREMFALIFKDYPGLQTAGRWSFYAALALSVAVSIVLAGTLHATNAPHAPQLVYILQLDRSIGFTLTVTIGILMLFLSRYPLHLDRNTYVASGFFSAMFLAAGAVKLLDSISKDLYFAYADNAEVTFAAVCFAGWGLMLRAAAKPAPARPAANKPREAELLQQLESLNQILSRSSRR